MLIHSLPRGGMGMGVVGFNLLDHDCINVRVKHYMLVVILQIYTNILTRKSKIGIYEIPVA
jgi:hypothetical protein